MSLPMLGILNQTITCVGFSPNGEWFATGSGSGDLKIWDVGSYAETHTLKTELIGAPPSTSFSRGGCGSCGKLGMFFGSFWPRVGGYACRDFPWLKELLKNREICGGGKYQYFGARENPISVSCYLLLFETP